MNERGVFSGKDYVLRYSQVILIYVLFQFLFLLPFLLVIIYCSLHLNVSYSASNFTIFIKT